MDEPSTTVLDCVENANRTQVVNSSNYNFSHCSNFAANFDGIFEFRRLTQQIDVELNQNHVTQGGYENCVWHIFHAVKNKSLSTEMGHNPLYSLDYEQDQRVTYKGIIFSEVFVILLHIYPPISRK